MRHLYDGYVIYNWLGVWNMAFMTFHILGMSSSQLTNSYLSEGALNQQPDNKHGNVRYM
jgi:hypothetical protein